MLRGLELEAFDLDVPLLPQDTGKLYGSSFALKIDGQWYCNIPVQRVERLENGYILSAWYEALCECSMSAITLIGGDKQALFVPTYLPRKLFEGDSFLLKCEVTWDV